MLNAPGLESRLHVRKRVGKKYTVLVDARPLLLLDTIPPMATDAFGTMDDVFKLSMDFNDENSAPSAFFVRVFPHV